MYTSVQYTMTSFMIRDILNLNSTSNCDTKQSEISKLETSESNPTDQIQLQTQSVSTICIKQLSRDSLSREVTQLSRDSLSRVSTATPEISYSLVDKRHPVPAQSISDSTENTWSRNKMKVRTVFTDIQR